MLDPRDASCEGLGLLVQEIGRGGAQGQEATGPGIGVDDRPDDGDEIRTSLHLIEDDQTAGGHQSAVLSREECP